MTYAYATNLIRVGHIYFNAASKTLKTLAVASKQIAQRDKASTALPFYSLGLIAESKKKRETYAQRHTDGMNQMLRS